MRNSGLWIVAGLMAASLCAAGRQTSGGNTVPTQRDEQEIRALYERFAAAFRAKDVDTVMQSYAPGGELFAFNLSPQGQYVGFDAYKKYYQEFFADIPGPIEKFEIQNLGMVTEGNLAYAHAIEALTATTSNGSKANLTLLVTNGLRKINGKWLITQEHISLSLASAMKKLSGSRMAANEASAVGSLRTLNVACVTYATTYGTGFPKSLSILGNPLGTSGEASATSANLINNALAGGTKDGYIFTYSPGAVTSGVTPAYTIRANPITPGETGQRYFFTDQSGVIRSSVSRPATKGDAPI